MNIETEFHTPDVAEESATDVVEVRADTSLLNSAFDGMDGYLKKAGVLKDALSELADAGDEKIQASVARLGVKLDEFEPSITMIGQVKAGKTSLVNAMLGWPDLLPADVNPWTSVVTSLHTNPQPMDNGNSALFKFFNENEWTRLLENGGRIGELASRAGAEDELETVRQQIERMREKSRDRLGRRFELLLGQEHDYGYFDQDLVERYVCLGDDFEDEEGGSDTQGRFADITKSADLFFSRPEFPTKLCIRDTPGVNDTFMMREQITIRAIRGSRLCIVVLSAHQALSSVDMALIRLISNIKSREVIIFVNRIDELADPASQVPEIRASIRKTLKDNDGPMGAQILFGSAYWANKALSGELDCMSKDSALSLIGWAEKELDLEIRGQSPAEMIWGLSGLPTLFDALSQRISDGAGQDLIDRVARSAVNLANGLQASNQVVSLQVNSGGVLAVDKNKVSAQLNEIEARNIKELEAQFAKIMDGFRARIERSHKSFLDRATASLIAHLDKHGEQVVWQYDPAGLRMLLRSAYQVFGAGTRRCAKLVFATSASDLTGVYAEFFGQQIEQFNIECPTIPRVPPPVFLGQTIALDLQGGWWKSWWQRRRGYETFAANFHEMIMQETDPIVTELKVAQAESIRAKSKSALEDFFAEQREILMGVVDHAGAGPEELKKLLGLQLQEDRKLVVENTIETLNKFVA